MKSKKERDMAEGEKHFVPLVQQNSKEFKYLISVIQTR